MFFTPQNLTLEISFHFQMYLSCWKGKNSKKHLENNNNNADSFPSPRRRNRTSRRRRQPTMSLIPQVPSSIFEDHNQLRFWRRIDGDATSRWAVYLVNKPIDSYEEFFNALYLDDGDCNRYTTLAAQQTLNKVDILKSRVGPDDLQRLRKTILERRIDIAITTNIDRDIEFTKLTIDKISQIQASSSIFSQSHTDIIIGSLNLYIYCLKFSLTSSQ